MVRCILFDYKNIEFQIIKNFSSFQMQTSFKRKLTLAKKNYYLKENQEK